MKNTLTLELRALRPPREVHDTDLGRAESFDIWGIHWANGSSRTWVIAVKCHPGLLSHVGKIRSGTRFVVVGRLDHVHLPDTGIPLYLVWADRISINPEEQS